MKLKFSESDKEMFHQVKYLVEANRYEMLELWKYWHGDLAVPWKEESRGYFTTIGRINKRPICVSIFCAKINGHRVAFYEGTSELVDHKMIDEWLTFCLGDTGRCDAGNFHQCIRALEETED